MSYRSTQFSPREFGVCRRAYDDIGICHSYFQFHYVCELDVCKRDIIGLTQMACVFLLGEREL